LVNCTKSKIADSEVADSDVVNNEVAEPLNKAGSEVYTSVYLYLYCYFNLIPSMCSFPPLDQSEHGLVSTAHGPNLI
jgi:hypothetical protein